MQLPPRSSGAIYSWSLMLQCKKSAYLWLLYWRQHVKKIPGTREKAVPEAFSLLNTIAKASGKCMHVRSSRPSQPSECHRVTQTDTMWNRWMTQPSIAIIPHTITMSYNKGLFFLAMRFWGSLHQKLCRAWLIEFAS